MFLKEYLPAISRFKCLLMSGTLAMLQAEIIFMKEPPGYFNHIHCGSILWMPLVNMTMDAARIPLLVLITAPPLIRGPPLCITVFSAEKKSNLIRRLNLDPKLLWVFLILKVFNYDSQEIRFLLLQLIHFPPAKLKQSDLHLWIIKKLIHTSEKSRKTRNEVLLPTPQN